MTRVAIALGSNLGDRLGNLRKALRLLKLKGINITGRSDIFETHPLGPQDQNRFLNACVIIDSQLSPQSLLIQLKDIEKQIGRIHRGKWGPREIDLDILLYENYVIDGSDLTIPHPEFHKRSFVLIPLEQLTPDWIHPVIGITIRDLKERLQDMDQTMVRIVRL